MDDFQLLAEFEDLLRTRPRSLVDVTDELHAWFGRARALVSAWDSSQGITFSSDVNNHFASIWSSSRLTTSNRPEIAMRMTSLLQEARFSLRMRTTGPLSVAVNRGQPFDYFDEVRKLIANAQTDILFVDPYLNADFVARYLPHIRSGITVRLLTSKSLSTLIPAVDLFVQQHGGSIELRKPVGRPHDRYVFIDKAQCYLSSATFQDGGRVSPATLQQIIDTFGELSAIYEDEWSKADVSRAA